MANKRGLKARTHVKAGAAADYEGCKLYPADGPNRRDETANNPTTYINMSCDDVSDALRAYFKYF